MSDGYSGLANRCASLVELAKARIEEAQINQDDPVSQRLALADVERYCEQTAREIRSYIDDSQQTGSHQGTQDGEA